MAYFSVKGKGLQYFDSEEEYKEYLRKDQPPEEVKPAPEVEAKAEQPAQPAQPEQNTGPDWWEETVGFAESLLQGAAGGGAFGVLAEPAKETIKVGLSSVIQLPEDTAEGVQQLAQTTPTSQLSLMPGAWFGSDPSAAMAGQLFARSLTNPNSLRSVKTPEGTGVPGKLENVPAFYREELEDVETGAKYAALGLQVPAKDGVVKPLGIGKETPILGNVAKGSPLYEVTNPETEFGRGASDIITILLQSALSPRTGASGLVARSGMAQRALTKAALKPNPANLRSAAAVVAQRLGADIPRDIAEELALGSTVRLDEQQEARVQKALTQISTENKDDLLKYLLSRTDAERDYYDKRLESFWGGLAGGVAFRGSFALLKNAFTRQSIKEISQFRALSRAEKLELEKLDVEDAGHLKEIEGAEVENIQKQTATQIGNITRNFNDEYTSSLQTLNENAAGLMRAQDAIFGTSQEAIGFGRRSIELGAEADVDIKEIDRLTKLDKARQSAIREMDRAAKADPNYLKKPSNKARYNRYKKQQAEYETRIKELETSTYGRLEEVESIEQRELMSGQQMDSMLAAQRMGRQTFQTNIADFFERINKLEEQFDINNQLLPEDARGDLNFRNNLNQLRQSYKRYLELLPEAVEGVEDSTIDVAKIKNEGQLLQTIQRIFSEIPNASSLNKIELKPEVVREAVKRLEAKQTGSKTEVSKTEEPKSKTPKTEEAVKTVQAEVVEDPWNSSYQTPLRSTENPGEYKADAASNPNLNRGGYTEQPPATKEVEMRLSEIDIFGKNIEEMRDELKKPMEPEEIEEFIKSMDVIYGSNDQGFGARADRSLQRLVSGTDTSAARALKLMSDNKLRKMPLNSLNEIVRSMSGYINALANAENLGFAEYYDFTKKVSLKNQKLLKMLPQAIRYSLVTGVNVSVSADRLASAIQKTNLLEKAKQTGGRPYRLHLAHQAKEALLMYQALGDFMQYRNYAGKYLASFKGKYRKFLAQKMQDVRKSRGGVTKADLEQDLITFVHASNDEYMKQINKAEEGLDEYINLPSHLRNVQAILDKAKDPDQVLDAAEEGILKELTNKLLFSSYNPHTLGSKLIEGDSILVRTLRSGGLTSPSTLFKMPVETGVMTAFDFVSKLSSGSSMRFVNFIKSRLGLPTDKEAQRVASEMTQTAQLMFHNFAGVMGTAAQNSRMLRMFNRSSVLEADNAGKFGRVQMSDPMREAEILRDLNSKDPANNTLYKSLVRLFGVERGQKYYNYAKVDANNLKDVFFLGDADKAMRQSEGLDAATISSLANKATPQGLAQVGLQMVGEATGNASMQPYKSAYTGGENVGGNIGFLAAEWATEYIASIYAQSFAKARAAREVLNELNEKGVPKYTFGTAEYDLAVQKKFTTKYMQPVYVGIGDDMQEIGYAIKDQEAIDLAKYIDMQEEFNAGTLKGAVGEMFTSFSAGNYKLFAAIVTPYIKAPLNAVARFVYFQPSLGPLPLGYVAEAAESLHHEVFKKVAYRMQYGKEEGYKRWQNTSRKLLGFQSQLNHPDPYVRQRANSNLILATTLNTGLLAIVMNSDLEITGGQNGTYRNALYADIPSYHVKLGGYWMPYRYIPFLGEMLAFTANYRDYVRSENLQDSQHLLGAGIAATAMSILDNPAVQGLDTILTGLQDPQKMESLLFEFMIKIGTGQLMGARKFALQTLGPDVYKTKRIISGARAGMVKTKTFDVEDLTPEEKADLEKASYMEKLLLSSPAQIVMQYGEKVQKFAGAAANVWADEIGIGSLIEYMDQEIRSQEVTEGDYRVAHWYKGGDVTYPGMRERTFFSSIAGKLLPYPAQDDSVDTEIFLNGIRNPGQVFRTYGILANEVALNRFNRYLGTEYKHQTFDENNNPVEYSVYEMFDRLIKGEIKIKAANGLTYDQLPDDYQTALDITATDRKPVFSNEILISKRKALQNLTQQMVARARVEFLKGERQIVQPDGSIDEVPIKFAAPADMQEEYQKYITKKPARS